jgi:hypothetical protein
LNNIAPPAQNIMDEIQEGLRYVFQVGLDRLGWE